MSIESFPSVKRLADEKDDRISHTDRQSDSNSAHRHDDWFSREAEDYVRVHFYTVDSKPSVPNNQIGTAG